MSVKTTTPKGLSDQTREEIEELERWYEYYMKRQQMEEEENDGYYNHYYPDEIPSDADCGL